MLPKTAAKAWRWSISGASTELVCYYGESTQVVASLQICGDHFSRDLAHALHVPLEDGSYRERRVRQRGRRTGTAENSVVELPFR